MFAVDVSISMKVQPKPFSAVWTDSFRYTAVWDHSSVVSLRSLVQAVLLHQTRYTILKVRNRTILIQFSVYLRYDQFKSY